MALSRRPRLPPVMVRRGQQTQQRVGVRLVAALLLVAGGTVSIGCSRDEPQSNQVIPAAKPSTAKAKPSARIVQPSTIERTLPQQAVATTEPMRRARPGETVTTSTNAPIYVTPGFHTPLRVLSAGSDLRVLATRDDWYQVEFKDPQWGTRVGFVAMAATHAPVAASAASEPVDLSILELKPEAKSEPTPRHLEPMDLSIRNPQ